MNEKIINWLLEGPSWVQYRTRLDLLGEPADSLDVVTARQAMLADPQIHAILADLRNWPGYPLKRHNDAAHPIHKLAFLADLGVVPTDPGMDTLLEKILAHQSPDGPFQVVMNIHPRYGGSGEDQLVWMLCDSPLILYSLIRLGLQNHPQIESAGHHLMALVRDDGWPCAVAPQLGRFKGPGKRDDPCPYANLVMLKALAQVPEWRDSDPARIGVETILDLWTGRKEKRPFLFAMGTHFSRLKVPLIWYDILHVTDVLSQFPWAHQDTRFLEMVDILTKKADTDGRFTPESVWTTWKGWEFNQKKEPSYWLTFVARRVLQRLEAADMM
jgi:hypothetical protein